jgi:starvation-inducible outer membrane lipoprotein
MYKYGSSFNCTVGRDNGVGGGEEGCTTTDYVSDNLNAIKEATSKPSCSGETYKIVEHNHAYIGKDVDVGGVIVAVMVTDDEDEFVTAVIFTSPETPTVV